MENKIIGILAVALLLLGSYTGYQYLEAKGIERLNKRLLGTVEESKRLEGELLQLRTEYKTEKTLRDSLNKRLSKLKTKLTEKTKLVADLSVRLGGSTTGDNIVRIDGGDSPEICYAEENTLGVFGFDIETTVGLLRDTKTGKYRMVADSFYVLDKTVDSKWAGKRYQITQTKGELEVDPTNESFKLAKGFQYLPLNLNLGINSDSKAILTTTLIGYGYRKQDLDFKLLSLGLAVGQDKKVVPYIDLLSIRPVPSFLTNTYLGIGYGKEDGFSLTISAGL